jgi:hypothetical protein
LRDVPPELHREDDAGGGRVPVLRLPGQAPRRHIQPAYALPGAPDARRPARCARLGRRVPGAPAAGPGPPGARPRAGRRLGARGAAAAPGQPARRAGQPQPTAGPTLGSLPRRRAGPGGLRAEAARPPAAGGRDPGARAGAGGPGPARHRRGAARGIHRPDPRTASQQPGSRQPGAATPVGRVAHRPRGRDRRRCGDPIRHPDNGRQHADALLSVANRLFLPVS